MKRGVLPRDKTLWITPHRDSIKIYNKYKHLSSKKCLWLFKEEAVAWWGDLVGKVERVNYIRGCCGNKDYIRPVIASFMNDTDKAEDFGPINERFLREELRRE